MITERKYLEGGKKYLLDKFNSYSLSLQTQSGQQRRRVVPQAHGLTRTHRVSAGRFAAGASGQRHTHPGSLWQGAGSGVHRGLCARVLAARLREMAALEEQPGQGGE